MLPQKPANQTGGNDDDNEGPDPTSLAISLLPLLAAHQLSLADLAAGLSVLPPAVAEAIQGLGQEIRTLREQAVVNGKEPAIAGKDGGEDERAGNGEHSREAKERWLGQEKIQHLQDSLSSLSSRYAELQTRHLTAEDALSSLRASVDPTLKGLQDERDALRAVNNVLRGKVKELQAEVHEGRKVIESMMEEVQAVNDWGIVEHSKVEVFEPIPSPSNIAQSGPSRYARRNGAPASYTPTSGEQRNSFPDSGNDSDDLLESHASIFSGPSTPYMRSPRFRLAEQQKHGMAAFPQTDAPQHRADRSLNRIAALSDELDAVRREARQEIHDREAEAAELKIQVKVREEELKIAMNWLEDVLSLRGYVVKSDSASKPRVPPTKASKDEGRGKAPAYHTQRSDPHTEALEREVAELAAELESLESGRLANVEPELRETSSHDGAGVMPVDPTDRQALKRALNDLTTQVVDLKRVLREVTHERDNLRSLHAQGGSRFSTPAPSEAGSLLESSALEALKSAERERDRANNLLRTAEARIYSLQRQLAEQEAEFEKVAERVREKLEEQRDKLEKARTEINTLNTTLDATEREAHETSRQLEEERRRKQSHVSTRRAR